ncbi:MAG TPA: NAD(+) kinase [Gammaproteobacteria bacterium]|nr:NAD(+) kinase [Gammaproteobacteria bacterium]
MQQNLFSTIGLIGKYSDSGVEETLTGLVGYLRQRERKILLDEATAEVVPGLGLETASRTELGRSCDLVIVVGGDGTLLNAVRSLAGHSVPLLGINLGHLGFLADISPDCMAHCLDEVLAGNYQEEERCLLHAAITRDGEVISESSAFNDVVVHKWDIARMIEMETSINGVYVNTIRADGLIVSTPTGSTAYALSGGGPILYPSLEALVLVPICPHTMSNRPIVVHSSSTVEVVVAEQSQPYAQVTCDGQVNLGLTAGDRVVIHTNPEPVRLIHPAGHDHFELLRAKLHWGRRLA